MRLRHRLLLLCTCGATVPALAAQQPPPPAAPPREDGQSVTVTGEREASEAERRREASRFVESHAVRTRIGQLARWHERICVRVGGLPLEMNARISNRVMDIAERIGIPTNRAEMCAPNVRIVFTSEPQRIVERAVRRNPAVIGFHYAAQRDRIMQVRAPVQAWYVTTTRSEAGGGMDPEGQRAGTIDQAGVRTPGGRADSRLTTGLSSGLAHVLIVADMSHVEGEEAEAIAELAAFLAPAQTPVAEACDDTDTILNLMNPACPPERRPVALTRQDVAYLRALYSVDPARAPQLQRGGVVLRMTETLGDGGR